MEPGQAREVSRRTIRAFTQYIVSVYRKYNYAGIYVYVPSQVMIDSEKLMDDILPVQILKALVSKVRVSQYDIEQNVVEKGYLSKEAVMEWTPRVGVINTNVLGIDDKFMAIYQAPWESGIEDNYSLYGTYDFPLMGPKLRLNVYGGYSQYDINPEAGDINFLGNGSFIGGILRYNALQIDGWFFDVTGSMNYERSKITPSLFPDFLGSNVRMGIWGIGVDVHRSTDMTNSSITVNRHENFDGSDSGEFNTARNGADDDFTIYTTTAAHSHFLDANKVQRLGGSLRWITSAERLIHAKMTTFGGMYSVRGYIDIAI